MMCRYRIERASDDGGADGGIPLHGDHTAAPWPSANVLTVDEYPWRTDAGPVAAALRMLYDDDALYLQWQVTDDHIRAEERPLNGEVWRDSCVELFASPHPGRQAYLNLESNCVGRFLLGYGRGRHDRRLVSPDVAEAVRVETSIAGDRKVPSPDDEGWWLAAVLPFEALSAFVGVDVTPTPGSEWRGNAYCCRGEPEPRYVTWSPIDAPEPDFHRPEYFGRFTFG